MTAIDITIANGKPRRADTKAIPGLAMPAQATAGVVGPRGASQPAPATHGASAKGLPAATPAEAPFAKAMAAADAGAGDAAPFLSTLYPDQNPDQDSATGPEGLIPSDPKTDPIPIALPVTPAEAHEETPSALLGAEHEISAELPTDLADAALPPTATAGRNRSANLAPPPNPGTTTNANDAAPPHTAQAATTAGAATENPEKAPPVGQGKRSAQATNMSPAGQEGLTANPKPASPAQSAPAPADPTPTAPVPQEATLLPPARPLPDPQTPRRRQTGPGPVEEAPNAPAPKSGTQPAPAPAAAAIRAPASPPAATAPAAQPISQLDTAPDTAPSDLPAPQPEAFEAKAEPEAAGEAPAKTRPEGTGSPRLPDAPGQRMSTEPNVQTAARPAEATPAAPPTPTQPDRPSQPQTGSLAREILDVRRADLGRALGARIVDGITSGRSTLELSLRPRNLGAVEIRVQMTGSDVAVQMRTQTQAAARLLAEGEANLARSIEASGLRLAALSTQTVPPPQPAAQPGPTPHGAHGWTSAGGEGGGGRQNGQPGGQSGGQGRATGGISGRSGPALAGPAQAGTASGPTGPLAPTKLVINLIA